MLACVISFLLVLLSSAFALNFFFSLHFRFRYIFRFLLLVFNVVSIVFSRLERRRWRAFAFSLCVVSDFIFSSNKRSDKAKLIWIEITRVIKGAVVEREERKTVKKGDERVPGLLKNKFLTEPTMKHAHTQTHFYREYSGSTWAARVMFGPICFSCKQTHSLWFTDDNMQTKKKEEGRRRMVRKRETHTMTHFWWISHFKFNSKRNLFITKRTHRN